MSVTATILSMTTPPSMRIQEVLAGRVDFIREDYIDTTARLICDEEICCVTDVLLRTQ